jgi:hypothetical protein
VSLYIPEYYETQYAPHFNDAVVAAMGELEWDVREMKQQQNDNTPFKGCNYLEDSFTWCGFLVTILTCSLNENSTITATRVVRTSLLDLVSE